MTVLNQGQPEGGKRILVIGGGKMGEAILAGWIASSDEPADAIGASDMTVVEPGEERRALLENTYGVACVADVADVAEALGGQMPDTVVLSV